MKIKRMICIVTVFVLAVGALTGCGANAAKGSTAATSAKTTASSTTAAQKQSGAETVAPAQGTQAAQNTQTTEPSATATGKTLVVYYSATGSTKAVAQTIAETAGADLFEITPVKPYTSDDLNWNNNNSRVSKEHNDESLRDVALTKVTPDNWESYDTVLIGYPIWWWIAAWPVDNFVKDNDFTGKTVIPFCTSASSGIGDSGNLLQSMAGTGNWQEGQRFSSGASAAEVQKWVRSLNLKKER